MYKALSIFTKLMLSATVVTSIAAPVEKDAILGIAAPYSTILGVFFTLFAIGFGLITAVHLEIPSQVTD